MFGGGAVAGKVSTIAMPNELKMVIGMSLAYVTSFAGLVLAWVAWRKHHPKGEGGEER